MASSRSRPLGWAERWLICSTMSGSSSTCVSRSSIVSISWATRGLKIRQNWFLKGTKLSSKTWELKKSGQPFKIKFGIAHHAHTYKPGLKKCDLCLSESTRILLGPDPTPPGNWMLLNKRTEIYAKCRHKKKYKLDSLNQTGGLWTKTEIISSIFWPILNLSVVYVMYAIDDSLTHVLDDLLLVLHINHFSAQPNRRLLYEDRYQFINFLTIFLPTCCSAYGRDTTRLCTSLTILSSCCTLIIVPLNRTSGF